MSEVTRQLTPLDDPGIVKALCAGHTLALGTEPSRNRLAVAWAQIALENAHGKALWCNNFGNITAFGRWPGDYYVIVTRERIAQDPDVWKTVTMKFRSYASPEQGAEDYWRLLLGQYPSVLPFFDLGSPGGAAHELARLHYFTADADQYAKTMTELYQGFDQLDLSS